MNEIYKQLRIAEQAVNAIWSFVLAERIASQNLQKVNAEMSLYRSNYKPGIWMTRICTSIVVVCFLLYFFLPQSRSIFGGYQRSAEAAVAAFIGFLALGLDFAGIVVRIKYGKPYHTLEARLPALEQELIQANTRLEEARYSNREGLAIAEKLLPAEAIDPDHIRMVAEYFEAGRVQTMAEALPMLEQQLYREKLGQLQRGQVSEATEATYKTR